MNSRTFLVVWAALSAASCAVAQPPPPEHPAEALTTVKGSIAQFNYGLDGRLDGMLITPNILIHLAPDWAAQFETIAHPGDPVQVTGSLWQGTTRMQVMQPQSLTFQGKRYPVVQPTQPAPYSAVATIKQLNYGPEGQVNGFVLPDGVFVQLPRQGIANVESLRAGVTASVTGSSYMSAAGRMIVDLQAVTVTGQQ